MEGQRADAVPAVFTDIEVVFEASGKLDPKKLERAVHLSITKYCSVAKMLEKSARISYRVKSARAHAADTVSDTSEIEVVLDRENRTFRGGETVTGQVLVRPGRAAALRAPRARVVLVRRSRKTRSTTTARANPLSWRAASTALPAPAARFPSRSRRRARRRPTTGATSRSVGGSLLRPGARGDGRIRPLVSRSSCSPHRTDRTSAAGAASHRASLDDRWT